ncbi:MAG: hypothetical protein LBV34_11835, partial [Nocardiopsaceae bacterium]|nr:hypothetical protein [Nocardiopsaceae bacterium]
MRRSPRSGSVTTRRIGLASSGLAAALVMAVLPAPASGVAAAQHGVPPTLPGGYKHLVVIYEENHSFDNLYGSWGEVGGRSVDGLAQASDEQRTQVAQDGTPYRCLLQNDVNLASPPLPSTCGDDGHGIADSAFTNGPFRLDDHIRPEDKTCPPPGSSSPNGVPKDSPGALPGGCTRDLVHRFYQNKYQINDGR